MGVSEDGREGGCNVPIWSPRMPLVRWLGVFPSFDWNEVGEDALWGCTCIEEHEHCMNSHVWKGIGIATVPECTCWLTCEEAKEGNSARCCVYYVGGLWTALDHKPLAGGGQGKIMLYAEIHGLCIPECDEQVAEHCASNWGSKGVDTTCTISFCCPTTFKMSWKK